MSTTLDPLAEIYAPIPVKRQYALALKLHDFFQMDLTGFMRTLFGTRRIIDGDDFSVMLVERERF